MKREDKDRIMSLIGQAKSEMMARKLLSAIRKLREVETIMDGVEVDHEAKDNAV